MRRLTKFWVKKIAGLKEYKIVWYTEEELAGRTFLCGMDGSHKVSNETRDHPTFKVNPGWFSHKHSHAGYNVQVAMDCFEQKIWDVTVSFGAENDKGNLHKSGLLTKCPLGCRIIIAVEFFHGPGAPSAVLLSYSGLPESVQSVTRQLQVRTCNTSYYV
jgi:hypothetical protein